jgi:hypothetical protein
LLAVDWWVWVVGGLVCVGLWLVCWCGRGCWRGCWSHEVEGILLGDVVVLGQFGLEKGLGGSGGGGGGGEGG